jgi:hypothetical protein
MTAEIQAAFFGVITRDAELRVSRSGAAFLQFDVRVGDDSPTFICVRSLSAGTVARAPQFVVGRMVYVEGILFINRKTAPGGGLRIEVDVQARFVRAINLGHRANPEAAAATTAESEKQ